MVRANLVLKSLTCAILVLSLKCGRKFCVVIPIEIMIDSMEWYATDGQVKWP